MKIRSFFQTFRAPGIVTAVLAFFLGISYIDEVVPSTGAGGFFQYKIGFLFPWLTVYSNTGDRRSTFDLLFSGNEGVHMNLLGLVLYVILVLLIGLLVQMLYDRVGRRNPQAGKDRKAPSNI